MCLALPPCCRPLPTSGPSSPMPWQPRRAGTRAWSASSSQDTLPPGFTAPAAIGSPSRLGRTSTPPEGSGPPVVTIPSRLAPASSLEGSASPLRQLHAGEGEPEEWHRPASAFPGPTMAPILDTEVRAP